MKLLLSTDLVEKASSTSTGSSSIAASSSACRLQFAILNAIQYSIADGEDKLLIMLEKPGRSDDGKKGLSDSC